MPDVPASPSPSLPSGDADKSAANRQEILLLLAATIQDLYADINRRQPARLNEQELQPRRIRTFGYLTGQYRRLLKDTDIDEMEDELALLPEAVEVTEDNP